MLFRQIESFEAKNGSMQDIQELKDSYGYMIVLIVCFNIFHLLLAHFNRFHSVERFAQMEIVFVDLHRKLQHFHIKFSKAKLMIYLNSSKNQQRIGTKS